VTVASSASAPEPPPYALEPPTEVPLPPEPNLPPPPLPRPEEPTVVRLPPKRPAVPRLDLSSVGRAVDSEPVGGAAALPSAPLTGGTSGSSSASSGGSATDGDCLVRQQKDTVAAVMDMDNSPEAAFHRIGSEAGNSSPSSKSSKGFFWKRSGSGACDAGKQHEDDADEPEVDWSYGRYVYERQRESFLATVRCAPLEGRRRLLLAALVLLQVALVLFFVDAGSISASATSASAGFSLGEARMLLGAFAAIAGVVTLCWCAYVRRPTELDVDREAQAMLQGDVEEVLPGLPIPTRAATALPRGRNYKELLRVMKEEHAARTLRLASEDTSTSAVQEEDLEAPSAAALAHHQGRRGGGKAGAKEARSWPGPDRRRQYSQVSDDEEGGVSPTLAVRGRRVFQSPASRRAQRVSAGSSKPADGLPEGWT